MFFFFGFFKKKKIIILLAQHLGQIVHLRPESDSSDQASLPPGNLGQIFVKLSSACFIDEGKID